ncbi:MAG: DUF5979 domain-containing protein [Brevundimonas sp.]
MRWTLVASGGLAAMLAAVGALAGVTPAVAVDGSVTGTVFRDFNANGVQDVSTDPAVPNDGPLAGVTVTAFDGHGTAVGTTVSGADGTYTVDVADALTSQLRLQFTDLPTGLVPSFSVLGAAAGESGSNVQLADVGDADVDFGVSAPDEFQKAGVDTPVVVPTVYAGQRQYQVNPGNPEQGVSLAAWAWQDQWTTADQAGDFNFVNDGTAPDPYFGLPRGRTPLALYDQTGGLWGTVSQKTTGDVFSAAVLRRQVDFGPGGLAAIYRVPGVLDVATGELAASPGPVETWLNLGQPFADLPAGVPSLGIDFGTFDTSYDTRSLPYGNGPGGSGTGGFIRPQDPAGDAAAYTGIGTIGIGSIAVSEDQSTLYVMNLHLRRIEVIDIATRTALAPIPLGLTSADRPWAITVLRGQIFVGYIENATAADIADVKAVVRAVPASSPAGLASPSSEVLRVDLDYQRGAPFGNTSDTCTLPVSAHSCVWHPWRDTFDAAEMGLSDPGNITWPQPMLTDLTLSSDGDLVLGFADRFGMQIGYANVAPFAPAAAGAPTVYQSFSAGETLIATPSASGYVLEDNGTVGAKDSASTLPSQGPGGREFFNDSNVMATDPTRRNEHQEITGGGLTSLPGSDQVLSTGFDTISEFRTNGFAWFNTTGDAGQAGVAQRGRMVAMPLEGALAKAGGLGDVATLLVEAPLQIGNVAWYDADHNGLQDADEPPVPGLTVQLRQGATVLATTTTDANGQYYFATEDSPGGGIAGFLPNSGDYTVRFVKPTTGNLFTGDARFGTVPWSNVDFTVSNAGSDDTIDSDVVVSGSNGDIAYTAGAPGENDPNLDAGFFATTQLDVAKAVGDDSLPIPADDTFTINLEARDFRGDPYPIDPSSVTLTAPGTAPPITGLPVGTQVRATEDPDPNYSVTIDPSDWFLVDGTSPSTVVTVTNTRLASTGFMIHKVVDDPEEVVPPGTTYTGTWSCTYNGETVDSGTWTVLGDATTTITSDDLWIGSECTITETPPADVPDGSWAPSVVFPATITLGADGTPVPIVTVTNTFDADSTGFSITKSVDDPGDLVPDDAEYSGSWVCRLDGEVVGRGQWTLAAGEVVTVADDLPIGATCVVTESTPPPVDGGTWERPRISGTVVLGAAANDPVPVITVDNALTPIPPPTPTPTPTPSVSPSPTPTPSPSATVPPGELGGTGAELGWLPLAVVALLVAGAALLLLRRRA